MDDGAQRIRLSVDGAIECAEDLRQTISLLALEAFKNFHLRDPKRVVYSEASASTGDLESSTFLYAFQGEGCQWVDWQTVADDFQLADFGLLRGIGSNARFIIAAVCLGDLRPSLESLTHAFGAFSRFDPRASDLGNQVRVRTDRHRSRSFDQWPVDDYVKGAGAHFEGYGRSVFFRPGERTRQTTFHRVKVVNREGLNAFAEMKFPIYPLSQHIFVNRLVVRDEMGNQTAEGSVKNFYVADESRDPIVLEGKVLHVPVPGLTIGGSFELIITLENNHPSETLGFSNFTILGRFPRQLGFFHLTGDATNLDYYLTPDIEVADLAHTLIEGIQSEEEKVRRIQNYLKNEFTYRAILFGICA